MRPENFVKFGFVFLLKQNRVIFQDGKCDVSYKNRKKCQKCRYEACLIAGMDPNLVLTEEQKKARYKKRLSHMTTIIKLFSRSCLW